LELAFVLLGRAYFFLFVPTLFGFVIMSWFNDPVFCVSGSGFCSRPLFLVYFIPRYILANVPGKSFARSFYVAFSPSSFSSLFSAGNLPHLVFCHLPEYSLVHPSGATTLSPPHCQPTPGVPPLLFALLSHGGPLCLSINPS